MLWWKKPRKTSDLPQEDVTKAFELSRLKITKLNAALTAAKAYLEDLKIYGLRANPPPSAQWDFTEWAQYLKAADNRLKDRAKQALDEIERASK